MQCAGIIPCFITTPTPPPQIADTIKGCSPFASEGSIHAEKLMTSLIRVLFHLNHALHECNVYHVAALDENVLHICAQMLTRLNVVALDRASQHCVHPIVEVHQLPPHLKSLINLHAHHLALPRRHLVGYGRIVVFFILRPHFLKHVKNCLVHGNSRPATLLPAHFS